MDVSHIAPYLRRCYFLKRFAFAGVPASSGTANSRVNSGNSVVLALVLAIVRVIVVMTRGLTAVHDRANYVNLGLVELVEGGKDLVALGEVLTDNVDGAVGNRGHLGGIDKQPTGGVSKMTYRYFSSSVATSLAKRREAIMSAGLGMRGPASRKKKLG